MQDFGSGDGGSNPPGGMGDGVLEPRHCFTSIVVTLEVSGKRNRLHSSARGGRWGQETPCTLPHGKVFLARRDLEPEKQRRRNRYGRDENYR